MFRNVLKVLLPVVVTLSLTLGALAWSASSVAFAAGQTGQGQTSATATPTPTAAVVYNNPLLPYNTPLYGTFIPSPNSERDEITVGRCIRPFHKADFPRSGIFTAHLCGEER